jgi:glycosyltransferase involved in cell wall biosynthesis
VKRFGIYVAFGPLVSLRSEGLGRLLAAFFRAAAARKDLEFTIACPEWSRAGLLGLFHDEKIATGNLAFLSTGKVPVSLRLYFALRKLRERARKESRRPGFSTRLRAALVRHRRRLEKRLASTLSPIAWLATIAYAAVLAVLLAPILFAYRALALLRRQVLIPLPFVRRVMRSAIDATLSAASEAGEAPWQTRIFDLMQETEMARLIDTINRGHDIQAWYSPTSFWPSFNEIHGPRLTCLPDVVVRDFPVGFGELEAEFEKHFDAVERTIAGGDHFLTYSSQVKWKTLVDGYSIPAAKVTVVPHAAMDLSGIDGADPYVTLRRALKRLGSDAYEKELAPESIRFLFYASQFRPNKNVLTLLRAYEYLLREKFLPHKLIMTGSPRVLRPIEEFITERNLRRDVICLHGLDSAELAACYRLAELAVNPSLSEGGCPFTLTEALSVGTPVVMARIPVTEEIVSDPRLQQLMLFDPYDWRNAAARIEWALNHRTLLLNAQKPLYDELRERTWDDVVDEVIGIMERISDAPHPAVRAAAR